jgi:hypothetical protein
MASVLDSILTAVKARADALSLTIDGHTLTAQRRTELVLLDGIDTKPIIAFKGTGPEDTTPFETGDEVNPDGTVLQTYQVEIALLSAQNHDPTKDDAELAEARQKLRRAYAPPDWPEVPEFYSARLSSPAGPGPGPEGFREGLRPDVLRITIQCVEPSGNS